VRFETTEWSVVLAAGGEDSSAARAALETLCAAYWYPIYAFIRRRGRNPDDARDLTQGFLASLLERRSFSDLSRDRGRFRAFLRAALEHYLANEAAHDRARKRGGGMPNLPLEFDTAEGRYRLEPAEPATPETIFERRWALTMMDDVLSELRLVWTANGRTAEFDALKATLLGDAPVGGYAELARSLDTTEGAIKVAIHRLRRSFQERLRARIAATVDSPEDVDDELRYLVRAMG
jgi:RNA polymerase sigma-70 factor (ECF subfamily)